MPRVVMLLTASLLGLCLVSGQAEARELTSRERAYSRALGKLLDLKPKGAKALTSKTGARGVKVRFLGLDVTRLHFRSAQAALSFAKRRSREKSGRQRIALKGQEILVLRGARLSNAAFSTRAVKAGWDASVRSPSKETKDGLLGPLDAAEARQAAKRGPLDARAAAERGRALAAKQRGEGPKAAPGGALEAPTFSGPRGPVRSTLPGAVTGRGRAKKSPPPRGFDLSGAWQTLSPGRISFRRIGQTKGFDVYEVLCVDFDQPCPPLVGSFSGRRLILRPAQGKGAQAEFLWTPNKVGGGRFVRISGARDLLPGRTSAFWRAPKGPVR